MRIWATIDWFSHYGARVMKHNVMKRNEITMRIIVNNYWQQETWFVCKYEHSCFTVCALLCGKIMMIIY